MGFGLDTLLGGSETQGQQIDPQQKKYLEDLWSRGQMQSYGNQGTDFANQINQGAQQGFGQQLQGGFQTPGLQQGFQNFGQQSNQALGGAIDAGLGQINRNFSRNIMPQINQGAALSGTSGGSRQGIAQGLAASDANQQATDFVNQMQSQNWQNQMQNQMQGLQGQAGLQGQQNQMLSQGMQGAPGLSNLGFGSQYGNLNALNSLIGGPTVLGGGSSQTRGLTQGFSDVFGGAAMMSDRRLKRNIKRIGTTPGGNAWYSFNYLWSDEPMQGVMADEVDSSITIDVGGYKAVDYSRVK